MAAQRPLAVSKTISVLLLGLCLLWLAGPAAPPSLAEDKPKLPAAFDKVSPEGVQDLKDIQEHVRKVLEKVVPCTVGVVVGAASGSGVIVSKDGFVLTAGHVSGAPGKDVTLILHDGKRVKGKTLGNHARMDSGMIKITAEGEWPFVEMGVSADLKLGQWTLAVGHPGGYRPGRSPVVRLGRIVIAAKGALTSDCTLVGGDSGGPLFDMHGKVVGIHSRIGGSITANVHVPVDTYRDTWDQLVKSEVIGNSVGNEPFVGIQGDPNSKLCVISQVIQGSPAEKAGLKPNDVIINCDGQKVGAFDDLGTMIRKKKPGDELTLGVIRGEEMLTLKLVIGKK